jgi:hypothetical protein
VRRFRRVNECGADNGRAVVHRWRRGADDNRAVDSDAGNRDASLRFVSW